MRDDKHHARATRSDSLLLHGDRPELVLALIVEAVDEAVGLALQRPSQRDAAPAAHLLRVLGEGLHRLRQTHELCRAQTLQGAVLQGTRSCDSCQFTS